MYMYYILPNSSHFGQPIDQCIGRTMQLKCKEKYCQARDCQHNKLLNGQSIKKWTVDDIRKHICTWVGDSWYEIVQNNKESLLQKSWKNCGLTLKADGSEDYKLEA